MREQWLDRYIDSVAVHQLVVKWLSNLTAEEMDTFFWDYPGPYDRGPVGYGIGGTVAKRIVQNRKKYGGTYSSLSQISAISGIGKDKVHDMCIQAREALCLGAYYQIPAEPKKLYEALATVGAGVSLSRIVKLLSRDTNFLYQRNGGNDNEIKAAHATIPFIALVEKTDPDRKTALVNHYPRVRVEPWAFRAHVEHIQRKLTIHFNPNNDPITKIERL